MHYAAEKRLFFWKTIRNKLKLICFKYLKERWTDKTAGKRWM
jgi:hypothetical protein